MIRDLTGSGVGLLNLVRLFANLRKCGRLSVWTESGRGEIWFDEGRVVAASLGQSNGLVALERLMLTGADGQFAFAETLQPEQRTIDLSPEALESQLRAAASARRAPTPWGAAVPRRVRSANEADQLDQMRLSRSAIRTLLATDDRRTVDEIIGERDPARVRNELLLLADLGLIVLDVPLAPATEAASPAPTPLAASPASAPLAASPAPASRAPAEPRRGSGQGRSIRSPAATARPALDKRRTARRNRAQLQPQSEAAIATRHAPTARRLMQLPTTWGLLGGGLVLALLIVVNFTGAMNADAPAPTPEPGTFNPLALTSTRGTPTAAPPTPSPVSTDLAVPATVLARSATVLARSSESLATSTPTPASAALASASKTPVVPPTTAKRETQP